MKVDLRIERLILDGVELTRHERAALGPAIERELRLRLDRGRGAQRHLDRGGVRGDALVTQRVDRIGRDVAAAVDSALPRRGGR
jgi:hypothetical protein